MAARAIRRGGYRSKGVADTMMEAGLTHGCFYAHLASRDAMLAEAADPAGTKAVRLKVRQTRDHELDKLDWSTKNLNPSYVYLSVPCAETVMFEV